MSQTAFSQHFGQELDFKQLLKRRGIISSVDQANYDLTQADRDWVRGDLLCPSCRCNGASLVLSDQPTTGRNKRQPHFRFVDAAGHTSHKVGCDFFAMDDAPGIQKGVDVRFSANNKDTKVVRQLVCRAIAIGEFSKSTIFDMRSWFLTQRDTATFEVKGSPALVDWLWSIHQLATYEALQFQPFHLSFPGFDARRAARRHLAYHYREFRPLIPRVSFDAAVLERAKRIVTTSQVQPLIAMEPLRPKYEVTARLARLLADYGDLPLTKRRSLGGIFGKTPEALLAFTATLLFASNWDEGEALARFARILAAADSEDQTLGNVIGLNPFHDFAALEIARFVATLAPESQRQYDFAAEFEGTVAMVRAARKPDGAG